VIDYANGVDIANDIIISSNTTQLNVADGETATQSGTILEDASPRPLEKTGGGTLIVASATNTGTTTISAGTWKAANALAFSLYSDHVVAAGATLDLNGNDQVISSLAGAGTVTSSAAGNITLAVGNFGAGNIGTTFSGVIEDGSGTVNLMVDGASGTFILTGANTYTGDTIICDCSVLQLGNGGATGSITSNVINNNRLIFNRSDDYDFTYTISDGFGSPGSVTQLGGGVLTLSGVNSYSGDTTVSNGILEVGNAGAIGTSTLVLDGGIVRPGVSGIDLTNDVVINSAIGTVDVASGRDFTLSGTISDSSGTSVLTKTGAGISSCQEPTAMAAAPWSMAACWPSPTTAIWARPAAR
jgi:autotransporter-associated beta strand protein